MLFLIFLSRFLTLSRFYYQFQKERLSACTSCIHALLHVADDIRETGPVWINWAFGTEHYCGSLLPAVKLRSHPYTAMSNYMLHKVQVAQIRLRWGLAKELEFESVDEISSMEFIYPECE